jgi:hypothetical protein
VKHKVEELEGSPLDAAVAEAEGLPWVPHPLGCAVMREQIGIGGAAYVLWSPSTEWELGGPIIERELIGIEVEQTTPNIWRAALLNEDPSFGPTPLIAAMRAYVASKFGDEVELP